MIPQVQSKQCCQLKIMTYNTLIEKSTFTPTVKNDAGWRSFYWSSRKQQLILKIVSQSPDVICLQQIRHITRFNSPNFNDFYHPLSQMGFQGVFAKRNMQGEFGEEGLAIFYNRQLFNLVQTQILYFNDGTGRHALAVKLRNKQGCIFTVATTHLIYPSQLEKAVKQVQLLSLWSALYTRNIPCFLVGDFNLCNSIQSHFDILRPILSKFNDSHQLMNCKKPTFSLNLIGSNSPGMIPQLMGTKIDYIFSSKQVQIINADVIGNIIDLPTMVEPSDHLPVVATFNVPSLYNPLIQDVKKLKQIFLEVRERQYNFDPKFNQFLQLFWLLPQSIKNTTYQLTYKKAVQLNLHEQNYQFGRIAFTNNTFHLQSIVDEQGQSKQINWQVVKHNLIPNQVIIDILSMIQQRVISIPQLIKMIQYLDLPTFLQKFDENLHEQLRNKIYGQTYKIAQQKGIYNQHYEFGKVSFRNLEGWNIQNNIRIKAMKNLQLP